MRFLMIVFAASLMTFTFSCSNQPDDKLTDIATTEAVNEQIPQAADTIVSPTRAGSQKDVSPVASQKTSWDKKIIKTGSLTVKTDNYNKYNNHIHELVRSWEGYIAGEEENSSSSKIENVLTIKVPVQFFDDAVQQLSSSTYDKLLAKQVKASDVTSEYFDTRSRIETKKRIRLRYLEMVQKAKNMEEVLLVEKEINALQEQIEAGEGRVNFLGHSAAYSTIHLTFFQELAFKEDSSGTPGFVSRMLEATEGGLVWFGELIIFLLRLWPIWIVAGGLLIFVRRKKK